MDYPYENCLWLAQTYHLQAMDKKIKNRAEAIKWLMKATKQGHELAALKLEVMLKEEKPDTQFFLG